MTKLSTPLIAIILLVSVGCVSTDAIGTSDLSHMRATHPATIQIRSDTSAIKCDASVIALITVKTRLFAGEEKAQDAVINKAALLGADVLVPTHRDHRFFAYRRKC